MKGKREADDEEVRFCEQGNLGSSPFAIAGVEPRQQENARAIGDAHQETPEAKLGGDPAVPGWASVGQAKAWHAATSLARVLVPRGVSAVQLYVLLEALLPRGWDCEAGIELCNEESQQRFRELGFIGYATVAILAMGRVAQANGSPLGELRAAAMLTACRHGRGGLAHALSGTCCQATPSAILASASGDNDVQEPRRAPLAWKEPTMPQSTFVEGGSRPGLRETPCPGKGLMLAHIQMVELEL